MGLDTAYIPVKRQDIEHFVADIVSEPSQLNERIGRLSKSKASLHYLREHIYSPMFALEGEEPFDAGLGFAACRILGFLHPYFFDRGQSLLNIAFDEPLLKDQLIKHFVPFENLFPHASHSGDSGALNYRSGLYIPEENVQCVLQALSEKTVFESLFLSEDSGLMLALRYAEKHQTGLLEAFDICEPMIGNYLSSQFNLRASFLNNVHDELVEADCECSRLTIGIPVPSSSEIDMDAFGRVIYEWLQQEDQLPAFGDMPSDQRAQPGTLEMTLMFSDSTPLVVVRTTENIFLRDRDGLIENIRISLSNELENHGLKSNFFISTEDESEVPADIASTKPCQMQSSITPRFIVNNHTWTFRFDGMSVEMALSLKSEMTVLMNGKPIDRYKLSRSDTHRTVFFSNGNWYTISVVNENIFSGTLGIKIHKGIFLQAYFQLLQGSNCYTKSANLTFLSFEVLTLFFGLMVFMMPKAVVISLLLMLLGGMYKYNKRYHYFLRQMPLDDEHLND
ncbi:hypothetical protein [Enterovibrio norvegicus]|uniref:hypothetical protein n=2 Tax=Enterovibrio norvegicus TaxID=188144 RepID=UPI00352D0329